MSTVLKAVIRAAPMMSGCQKSRTNIESHNCIGISGCCHKDICTAGNEKGRYIGGAYEHRLMPHC